MVNHCLRLKNYIVLVERVDLSSDDEKCKVISIGMDMTLNLSDKIGNNTWKKSK